MVLLVHVGLSGVPRDSEASLRLNFAKCTNIS